MSCYIENDPAHVHHVCGNCKHGMGGSIWVFPCATCHTAGTAPAKQCNWEYEAQSEEK